jgi:hypothetical protein
MWTISSREAGWRTLDALLSPIQLLLEERQPPHHFDHVAAMELRQDRLPVKFDGSARDTHSPAGGLGGLALDDRVEDFILTRRQSFQPDLGLIENLDRHFA